MRRPLCPTQLAQLQARPSLPTRVRGLTCMPNTGTIGCRIQLFPCSRPRPCFPHGHEGNRHRMWVAHCMIELNLVDLGCLFVVTEMDSSHRCSHFLSSPSHLLLLFYASSPPSNSSRSSPFLFLLLLPLLSSSSMCASSPTSPASPSFSFVCFPAPSPSKF